MVVLKKNVPPSPPSQTPSLPFISSPNFLNLCSIPAESMITRIPRPKFFTKYSSCLTHQTPETLDEVSFF